MEDWLLAAKSEALRLPSWNKMQDVLRRKIFEKLRRHDVSNFSDLSDVDRAVYVEEAHESLRNDPEFHAFQYELSATVDYHLLRTVGTTESEVEERAKLSMLLLKASQGACAILQRLPEQTSYNFLRGLINQELHPTLRAAVWRALLRHKKVQKWTATSKSLNESQEKARDVSERLKSLYTKLFPDATEKNRLTAASVCCAISSWQSTSTVSDITLHLSAAVCHVFEDDVERTTELENLTHLVEAVACLHDAVMSLALNGNLEHIQRLVPDKLRNVDINRFLQSFWDCAWMGCFPLKTSMFCLDQVVLSGRDGAQLVYVLLSAALVNHCADTLVSFHGDKDARLQHFNRCTESITPQSLSTAFLPYEKELFAHLKLTPPQLPIVKASSVLPFASMPLQTARVQSTSSRDLSHGADGNVGDAANGSLHNEERNASLHNEERNASLTSPFQAGNDDLPGTPITTDLDDVARGNEEKKTDPSRSRLSELGPQVEMDVLDALRRLPKEDFDPRKPRPHIKLGTRSRALPPILPEDTVCEICTHANLNTEDVAEQLIAIGLVDDRDVGAEKVQVRVGYVDIALAVSNKACKEDRYNQLSRAVRRYELHNDVLEQNLIAAALDRVLPPVGKNSSCNLDVRPPCSVNA